MTKFFWRLFFSEIDEVIRQLFFFFFTFFLKFYFTILYWFYHTLTWIRHGCTWVPNPEPPSHLSPHIISLGHPSAPAPSILYPVSNLDWWFISYMILYMFQCHSPKSSHPLSLPQSPKVCSIKSISVGLLILAIFLWSLLIMWKSTLDILKYKMKIICYKLVCDFIKNGLLKFAS